MLIGSMNHPGEDVAREIEKMADLGLEFIDLTLEPPAALASRIDVPKVKAALKRTGFPVVGHTAYYLPIASAFEDIRKAAVTELIRCVEVFAELGTKWMNLHPDRHAPMHSRSFYIERNLASIAELARVSERYSIGLMIENLPGDFNTPEQLGEILDVMPELGLHLDIAHANLLVAGNTTEAILDKYGARLRHVHLHDNKGGYADLHMPLGTGTVDIARSVSALKRSGYDSTITLEVFTPDKQYLLYSKETLRRIWEKTN